MTEMTVSLRTIAAKMTLAGYVLIEQASTGNVPLNFDTWQKRNSKGDLTISQAKITGNGFYVTFEPCDSMGRLTGEKIHRAVIATGAKAIRVAATLEAAV